MVRLIAAAAALLATVSAASAAITQAEAKRLEAAATIVQSITSDIPEDMWSRARSVVVIPDLKKAAFIVGGEYGKGASREISVLPEARDFLRALGAVAPATAPRSTGAASTPPAPRTTTTPTTDDDLRARVVDIQQSLDRILADTTPAAVGTSGTTGTAGTTATGASASGAAVTVERARLMQLRQQLDALLASLNRR